MKTGKGMKEVFLLLYFYFIPNNKEECTHKMSKYKKVEEESWRRNHKR